MPFYLEKPNAQPAKIELYEPEKVGHLKAIQVRIESLSRHMKHYVIVSLSFYGEKVMGQLNESDYDHLACDTGSVVTLKKTPRDL